MTVVFRNEGLVPMEAFTSFGVSAKVGTNPIGEFGTGLKMAVAVILRLGGVVRVFRDSVEYEFYTEQREFRGKEFNWCRMRKRRWPDRWRSTRLPFTTELARKWAAWQAVREIEANCRDESGSSCVADSSEEISHGPGETVITVDCDEFEEAYQELGKIFLDTADRRIVHENSTLRVWSGGSDYVFFKGLRVTDLREPSLFTYEMKTGVDLTEDRTSKYPFLDAMQIRRALAESRCREIYGRLLEVEEGERCFEMSMDWDQIEDAPDLLAAISSRVAGGHYVMPRMLSSYERMYSTTVLTRDSIVEISLTVGEWLEIAESSSSAEAIHEALADAGWRK